MVSRRILTALAALALSSGQTLAQTSAEAPDTGAQGRKAFANACGADLKSLCSGVEAGEGRLIQCLEENLAYISAGCAGALNDRKTRQRQRTVAARSSSGTCTIMRGETVLDQQGCGLAETAPAAPGTTRDITYVWPSGNRTNIGGAGDDFTVNGNTAVPLPDAGRGLCLRVEKTGNTFCYNKGATPKAAAAPAVPVPVAAVKPADVKKPAAPAAPTPPAAAAAAPAATAPPAPNAELAEETRLRKDAEAKVKSLEAEVASLNETKDKSSAELSEKVRILEAQQKQRDEAAAKAYQAEQVRADAVLTELDNLETKCRHRDGDACERAIALSDEAAVTGSIDGTRRGELQRLRTIALAPFGVPMLGPARSIPVSTWIAGALAAILGFSLLRAMARRPQSDPLMDAVRATPSLEPSLTAAPPPLPSSKRPPTPGMLEAPQLAADARA